MEIAEVDCEAVSCTECGRALVGFGRASADVLARWRVEKAVGGDEGCCAGLNVAADEPEVLRR